MGRERYNDVQKVPIQCFRCEKLKGRSRDGKIIYSCELDECFHETTGKNVIAPAQKGER